MTIDPMKVLHVIHSVDLRSGGPSHALRRLAALQAAAGLDVSIITTDIQSAKPWLPRASYVAAAEQDDDFAALELFVGKARGGRGVLRRWGYSSDCKRWLQSRLTSPERKPDILHIHGLFSHLTSTAAKLAHRYEIPYVIRPAGGLNDSCLRRGNALLKRLVARWSLQTDLHSAAVIQAMSESESLELRRWVRSSRIVVIPHGVDVPEVNVKESRERLNARFPELRNSRIVCFLSRLHEKKRPEWLVEALSFLGDAYSDVKILFAGPDSGALDSVHQAARQAGVLDRIVYAGFLSGQAKTDALAGADVFALPSVNENFGVAVIEAMAAGTPVVVTRGVASSAHVEASGAGVIAGDSPTELAQALKKVLTTDRDQFSRFGQAYVREALSWDAVIEDLADTYRRCINTKHCEAC